MRILITGNRGFVGAATQRMLEGRGHQVFGFDMQDGVDICDEQMVESAIEQSEPDRILHLCAVARFADADKDPVLAFEVNALGTRNLAYAADAFGVPVVHASTGSVYMPIKQPMPITEEFPIAGNSIYGCSKAVAEKYIQQMNTQWMILRYGHLYGAEKRGHGLIGGYLDAINAGRNPKLFGGGQTNDFMYINDVARANVVALESENGWGEAYNIGTGVELSAKEAGEIVCRVFGYDGPVDVVPQRSVDPDRFAMDVSKIRRMLGFEADYSFEAGLKAMHNQIIKEKAA